MGETQVSLLDDLDESLLSQLGSDISNHHTVTISGEKIYVIGESKDGSSFSFGIQIFNKSTEKWVTPIVLGTKPVRSKDHSAMLLGGDRILVVKQNSSLDDCAWFLEINTPFIREQRRVLDTEVVAWSRGVEGDSPKPVIISGPSGVGKGTLISRLMKEFPSTFGFSVSHTTRLPRENEKDGVHYHFTQKSAMEKEIQEGKFLEHASVHGNLYGTSIEAVEAVSDEGKRCILDIDVQGARAVRASSLEAIFIFVCPPSFEELEKRLRSRGTETEEQVQKRLRNARTELEQGKTSGLFEHILVNDDLESCYTNLKKILGLDGFSVPVYQPPSQAVNLPLYHFISKYDQRTLIHCGTAESLNGSGAIYTIDVSSLKGGAPWRTRGLRIQTIDPSADCSNGMKEH